MKRLRSGVAERSRAAVDKAGTRAKSKPVDSAGTWGPSGKRKEGPFRPGKTAAKRKTGRVVSS